MMTTSAQIETRLRMLLVQCAQTVLKLKICVDKNRRS